MRNVDYNDYRASVWIYDEDYDGNLSDDQFNGSHWGSYDIGNNYTFKKLFAGYYKLNYFCNWCYNRDNETWTSDKPNIIDVIDAETNESIYERKEDTGALYDLINIGSDIVKSSHLYKIILEYWYGRNIL